MTDIPCTKFFMGPLLWKRQAPADAMDRAAAVPDYRVIQDEHGNISLESECALNTMVPG